MSTTKRTTKTPAEHERDVQDAKSSEARARLGEQEARAEVAHLRVRVEELEKDKKRLETELEKEKAKSAKAPSLAQVAQFKASLEATTEEKRRLEVELEKFKEAVALRTPPHSAAAAESKGTAREHSLQGKVFALVKRVDDLTKEAAIVPPMQDEFRRVQHELSVLFSVPADMQKELVTGILSRLERATGGGGSRKREREEGEVLPPAEKKH